MTDKKHLPELKFHNSKKVDQAWGSIFDIAMTGRYLDNLSALSTDSTLIQKISIQIRDEKRRRERDITNVATNVGNEVDDYKSIPDDFENYRCLQCRKKICLCAKIISGKKSYCYTAADYTPQSTTEDGLVFDLALKRKLEETSYAPYGDSPELRLGDKVRICLNSHIYQGHWGVVVGERRKGEYLIEIRSRRVPKTFENGVYEPNPPYPLMYARAEALTLVNIEIEKGA